MAMTTALESNVKDYCLELANQARAASRKLVSVPGRQRDDALRAIADRLIADKNVLQEANAKDLAAGEANGLSSAMLDRLKLTDDRIESMADSVRQIAEQVDPVGEIIEGYVRPNQIRLEKVRVPIGVILIIFESRPNVTSDAAALCIKSGNAVILRGGKEAIHSNNAIARCVQGGLSDAGLDPSLVQLVETTDRAAVGELLKLEGKIDLAIPRGGESLIRAVVQQAHIPVIKHYTGNCHVYVDAAADEQMAIDICVNAKTHRTGVCNAAETILFHIDTANSGLMGKVLKALSKKGVQLRGDSHTREHFSDAVEASESDWAEEYLDMICAIKIVQNIDEAIEHINQYGSQHTDAIVTNAVAASEQFVQQVDTANAFINCSTRFSDGGEYGLGAEIGISTDKLHARGPMGAKDLTTYKWIARGNGQVR